MTFDEYQESAYKTAIYKDKIIYPSLGLINEMGEFLEKFDNPSQYGMVEVAHEAGDVMWYIAALCTDLGIRCSTLENDDNEPFYDSFMYLSRLAGKVKKWMRDENKELTAEFVSSLQGLLSKIYSMFNGCYAQLSYPMEEIYRQNLDKLNSRMARNVIQGNGDYR